jgi:RHS repeat-associated protein
VRDVVDSQGNTLNHRVYDSFGNVTSQTNGAINFRFGYTGRELDAETGLYYYRARYYDPQTGQFIGQDPLSFRAGDSNLYRYAGNSPATFTDPSGLLPTGPIFDRFGISEIFNRITSDDYTSAPLADYLTPLEQEQERQARKSDVQNFERASMEQIGNMWNAKRQDGKEPTKIDRLKAVDPNYNKRSFRKGNYDIWGPIADAGFRKLGPAHQLEGFMDFYLDVDGTRKKNKWFS